MISQLISAAQRKLNLTQEVERRKDTQDVFLQLVLLNYQPISRYFNGRREFLYVNLYDAEGHAYYLPTRALKRDKGEVRATCRAGLLDDVLALHSRSHNFMEEICAISNNTLVETTTIKDGQVSLAPGAPRDQEIFFMRSSLELQAIMFQTREFNIVEQAFLNGIRVPRINNYQLPTKMQGKGGLISSIDWVKAMYATYMFYRNLELTDYYYTNQSKPNQEFFIGMNTVYTYDEYIPLGYKFYEIYNPLLDNCIDLLKDRYRIFTRALDISPLSMVGGMSSNISKSAETTYGLYTTRAEMSSMFNLSCFKLPTKLLADSRQLLTRTQKHTVNFYSPKYFLTVLYTQIAEDLEEELPLLVLPLDSQVVYRYTQEAWTDADAYMEFTSADMVYLGAETNYIRSTRASAKKYLDHTVSWINGLYCEYLLTLYGGLIENTAWTKTGPRAKLT